ncbi:universal stress protein [Planomonospora corallina]|uniref:Universal stress protein n=1 Tax=Planomonospora corallina TaxID=1806052 RepID=A0ABV8IE76_9ACTN
MEHIIVAGTDGSPAAAAAVEWAADDAGRRGMPLRIVCAVERWPHEIVRFPDPDLGDALNRAAEKVLAEAEAVALRRRPGLEVTTRVLQGSPAMVLREQAESAAGLVMGSRGLGGFAGAVLGSVSMHVAGHVHRPVVVVRSVPQEARGEVAVGFDDSPACEPALGYAFEQAALRGAGVRAVYAWQLPVHAFAPEVVYDVDEIRAGQQRVAEARLQGWRQRYPQVPVVEDVRQGHPVEALTEVSGGTDLVVVGSHGRGAVGAVLLGSVSRGVLHHARCPVAVVRS